MINRFLASLFPFGIALMLPLAGAAAVVACETTYDTTTDQPPADCPPAPPAEGTICGNNAECGPEGACFIVACLDGGCVPRTRLDGAACSECGYSGTCQAGVCTKSTQ